MYNLFKFEKSKAILQNYFQPIFFSSKHYETKILNYRIKFTFPHVHAFLPHCFVPTNVMQCYSDETYLISRPVLHYALIHKTFTMKGAVLSFSNDCKSSFVVGWSSPWQFHSWAVNRLLHCLRHCLLCSSLYGNESCVQTDIHNDMSVLISIFQPERAQSWPTDEHRK